MASNEVTPSTMAASTTWPLPLEDRSRSAARMPVTRNIDPPPKSATRLSGGTGLRPGSPIAAIAPVMPA